MTTALQLQPKISQSIWGKHQHSSNLPSGTICVYAILTAGLNIFHSLDQELYSQKPEEMLDSKILSHPTNVDESGK